MRNAIPFVIIALLLCVTMAFAQDPVRKVLDVPKVDPSAITIDGVMNEPAWSNAAHADVITPAGFEVWASYYGRTSLTEPDYDQIYARMLYADDTLYVFIHVDEFVNDSTKLYFASTHYGDGGGSHWKSDQIYVGISSRLGIASWGNWDGAAYTMPEGPYHLMIMGDYVTFNDDESVWIPPQWRGNQNDSSKVFAASDIIRWAVKTDTTTGVWDVEMAIYNPGVQPQGSIGFDLAGSASSPGLSDSYGYWIWQPSVPDDPFGDPTGENWNTYYIQQNSKYWPLLKFVPGPTDTVLRKVVDVPYVDPAAMTIDGLMNESEWANAGHADVITPAGFEVWASYYGRTSLTEPDYDQLYGRMLWTDDTLYVFMHIDEFVNDSTKLYFASTHYGDGGGSHWKSDQLYVGLSNRLGMKSWGNWDGAAYTAPDGPYHLMIMGQYVTFNDDENVWIPENFRSKWPDTMMVIPASNWIRSAVTFDTTTGRWDVEMAIYHPSVTSQSSVAFDVAGSASSPGLSDSYGYWIWQPNVPDDPFGDPTGANWNTYYIQQNSERWALLNMVGHVVGVRDPDQSHLIPSTFTLSQNYPNPFNPSTRIAYALPKESSVRMAVYNVLGQTVATLVNERQNAGRHEVTWNASNVSSGVYFLQLSADGKPVASRKMMLLK